MTVRIYKKVLCTSSDCAFEITGNVVKKNLVIAPWMKWVCTKVGNEIIVFFCNDIPHIGSGPRLWKEWNHILVAWDGLLLYKSRERACEGYNLARVTLRKSFEVELFEVSPWYLQIVFSNFSLLFSIRFQEGEMLKGRHCTSMPRRIYHTKVDSRRGRIYGWV